MLVAKSKPQLENLSKRINSGRRKCSARVSSALRSSKSLAWYKTVSHIEDPLREKYAEIVPELLRESLQYEKMSPG